MGSKGFYSLSFHSTTGKHGVLSWSPDNRIALACEAGVYILVIQTSPTDFTSSFVIHKEHIPASKDVCAFDVGIDREELLKGCHFQTVVVVLYCVKLLSSGGALHADDDTCIFNIIYYTGDGWGVEGTNSLVRSTPFIYKLFIKTSFLILPKAWMPPPCLNSCWIARSRLPLLRPSPSAVVDALLGVPSAATLAADASWLS